MSVLNNNSANRTSRVSESQDGSANPYGRKRSDRVISDASRRGVLRSMAGGSMLFPALVSQLLAEDAPSAAEDPLAPKPPHFAAKAKRVILLFMSGGVSHVDSWDPKPKPTWP